MTRARQRWLLVVASLVFLLYAYPGYMTTGGVDQLLDARAGTFTDWAPAMMTEVWRIVGWVFAGPAGMLVLQGTLAFLGCRALVAAELGESGAAITATCMLLFPPVLASLAVIWPESQFAGFALAGAAAIGARRTWVRVAGFALLLVACGMGPGASAALLPLLVWRVDWRGRRAIRVLIACAAWVTLTTAATVISSALVDRVTYREDVARASADVVAILCDAEPLDDAHVREALAGVELAASDQLQQHACEDRTHPWRFFGPTIDAEALLQARRSLALAHPRAFLVQRGQDARRTLGLVRGKRWLPIYTGFLGARSQHDVTHHLTEHSAVQKLLLWPVRKLSRTMLFHPYAYALLALVLLGFAIAWRRSAAIALLTSGLLGEIAMLAVGRPSELRCSLWLIATTVIAAALLLAYRASQARES